MAIAGIMTSPVPKSPSIMSKVTISYTGSVEFDSDVFGTRRSNENGGIWNDGIPDLISPAMNQVISAF